jgi:hypothetical protein
VLLSGQGCITAQHCHQRQANAGHVDYKRDRGCGRQKLSGYLLCGVQLLKGTSYASDGRKGQGRESSLQGRADRLKANYLQELL